MPEMAEEDAQPSRSEDSSSFRLRSSSLNTLRLRRIFDVFDRNGDGMITAHDLCRALERLGLQAGADELEHVVECYMKAGNAGLEFDDFEALHRSLGDSVFGGAGAAENGEGEGEGEDSDLTEAFKVFDEDGDGFISARELKSVLEKLDVPEGRDIGSVELMIGKVDRNNDGLVDFLEFKNLIMQRMLPVQSG